MPTVKEILRDKVTLDIRSVDRVLLNGWVQNLQMPGGVVTFIREQCGWPIPSPVMLNNFTVAFRTAVEQFAAAHGLEIVDFEKGASKEERAQAALAQFPGKSGVVLIGKAPEEASSFKGRRDDRGTKVWVTYRRERVWVTHYYFYVLDIGKLQLKLVNLALQGDDLLPQQGNVRVLIRQIDLHHRGREARTLVGMVGCSSIPLSYHSPDYPPRSPKKVTHTSD